MEPLSWTGIVIASNHVAVAHFIAVAISSFVDVFFSRITILGGW
jgi:hypothetical protein